MKFSSSCDEICKQLDERVDFKSILLEIFEEDHNANFELLRQLWVPKDEFLILI